MTAMQEKRLLMFSTDRLLFDPRSAVSLRHVEYSKSWDKIDSVVFAKKEYKDIELAPNMQVHSTHSSSRFLYWWDAFMKSKNFVGVTHVTCQDPFETALTGILYCGVQKILRRDIPHIEMQIHTDLGSPFFLRHSFVNRFRVMLSYLTLRYADRVRVVSERIKKTLIEKYSIPEEKIEVRPIEVSIQSLIDAPITIDLHRQYPQHKIIIFMASRLEAEKNIEQGVRALATLVEKGLSVGLVIAGRGSEEGKLARLAVSLGVEKYVHCIGWQSSLATLYKTSDIFLSTSQYEGYGMSLVEAQALGLTIVTTDVGVAPELVQSHPDQVLMVPVGDIQTLVVALETACRRMLK